MSKNWRKIDLDEILNYEEAHTGNMARYERIMRQHEITAMENVPNGLLDLNKSMHLNSDKLSKRIQEFNKSQQKL